MPVRPPAEAVGVVLCGGSSRRMGTDKAVLDLDGVAMARRTADALRRFGVGTVLTVGGDGPALAGTGDRHVTDLHPEEGPLGGVVTAAAAAPGADLVVAACDLPDLAPDVLTLLWQTCHDLGGDRPVVPCVGDQVQWAVAVVPAAATGRLAGRFDDGARSLRSGFGEVAVVDVDDGASLQDLDTPVDVARWRSRSGARE